MYVLLALENHGYTITENIPTEDFLKRFDGTINLGDNEEGPFFDCRIVNVWDFGRIVEVYDR